MIKTVLKFIRSLLADSRMSDQNTFLKGAFLGLSTLSVIVFFLAGVNYNSGLVNPWLVGAVFALLAFPFFKLLQLIAAGAFRIIVAIPIFVFSILVAAWLLLDFADGVLRFGPPNEIQLQGIAITIICFILLFGSGYALLRKAKYKAVHATSVIAAVAALVFFASFLFRDGKDPYRVNFRQVSAPLLSAEGVADPSERGSFEISTFTYGSGTDKQRDEFRSGIKYKSDTVDASRILPEWKGDKAKWRERYWGFGVKNFPLNGRVWMPVKEGPLPLVLIVHGNHGMEDHSDPGYEYLGELLASRGFITVSVDENFINATWSGDFRGREMPARGWLLLKHLAQWRKWNEQPGHDFYHKVDLDRVILAGHSRGGEAVAIAAAYNKLSYFPDDATEKFNFNFGIKGIISIAPTDKRYFRRLNLANINYLSLQGSYDSDESSFFGMRQAQRISFSDSSFHFKTGIYIHGANHGQFNTTWGKYDSGTPGKYFLNTAPMISGEDQRQVARVCVSAFAEAVINNKRIYLRLFKNPSSAADWLPDVVMLNRYEDSQFNTIADFEEDVDIESASASRASISAQDLVVWREEPLKYRDDDWQNNNSVVIGWNRKDSVRKEPVFQIKLAQPINLDSAAALSFNLSPGKPDDLKLKGGKSDSLFYDLDFTIRLTDSAGRHHDVQLTTIKKLVPPLKIQFAKLKSMSQNWGDVWEPTLQTIIVPLDKFGIGAGLSVSAITFSFDRSEKGIIILDDIGLVR